MFFSYLLVFQISFFVGGWSGMTLYFSNWFNFHLAYMSLILYMFVLYGENNVVLVLLSNMTIFLSLLFFSSSNMLFFYMSFELLMIPMMIMIFYFGSQPEKISSVYYMVIYTSLFSYPLLYQIMSLDNWLVSYFLSPFQQLILLGAFLAKIPMFGLHYWLPKAHVEAPTSASMLLAGVLLKVGLYGLMKMLFFLNMLNFIMFFFTFMSLLLSSFYATLSVETKVMVAYSSVTHMNLGLYSLNLISNMTMSGNYILSISHGYISALMFYMVGMLYKYNGSRILYYISSLLLVSGLLSSFFCFVMLGNAGIPPLLSFWSEIMMLVTLLNGWLFNFMFLFIIFMFGFYYSIYIMVHLLKPGLLLHFSVYHVVIFMMGTILLFSLVFIM